MHLFSQHLPRVAPANGREGREEREGGREGWREGGEEGEWEARVRIRIFTIDYILRDLSRDYY